MDNASFNNDLHLNYEELVAYSQGNLSNREMHRLETHLISCELCNDALDGIAKIDEAVLFKSLTKVQAGTATGSTGGIAISKKQWLAIAASVALVAVVSVVFLLIPKNQDTLITEQLSNREEAPLGVEERSTIAQDSGVSARDAGLLAEVSSEQQDDLFIIAPEEAKEVVVEEESLDLAFTEVPDSNIDMAANDTTLTLGNLAVNDSAGDGIAEEADVDAAARSKKMAAAPMAVQSQAIEEATVDVVLTAVQEKGTRHYNRYLKRNLKYPKAAKEDNIAGDVILELTINVFGSITNIAVIQAIGYGCDQEAMRLVREGPKWTPGSINDVPVVSKVKVTVPFKL